MIAAKTLLLGALAAGLVAAGGATSPLHTSAAPAESATTLAAFSIPTDHHRDWDGDRRGDRGWDGHPWRWWHDWGISADTCRDGGGHVRWDHHRCEGGRFDDFHVR